MAIYQIGHQSIHSDDPALPETLAAIYAAKQRPLCLCRHPGIEMYVAKVEDKILKIHGIRNVVAAAFASGGGSDGKIIGGVQDKPKDVIGDAAPYLQEGMVIKISLYDGTPVSVELPQRVTLEVEPHRLPSARCNEVSRSRATLAAAESVRPSAQAMTASS